MEEYRCVLCGFAVKSLYIQYSPGNIRLVRCHNCKAVADEYLECEFMIIVIDLFLLKPKAYRHLLYNVIRPQIANFQGLLWKLAVGFLLLDGYRSLILRSSAEWASSTCNSPLILTSLKVFSDVILGNLMFILIVLVATRTLSNTSLTVSGCRELLLAVIVSSYFKILLSAMMVWEFPSPVVYIIDLYVLSSNSMSLKVITELPVKRCIGVCFAAQAAKFVVPMVLVVS